MAGLDAFEAARWELAATSALLERSLLARRLHNGPLQDIAAAMLQLQIEANRTDQESRPAFEQAIAILIEQQRAIRHMVEGMLEGSLETSIAVILEALAMQQRALGHKLTWKVTPSDATLPAAGDLPFRLKLLESLGTLEAEAQSVSVLVERSPSGMLDVSVSGSGTGTVSYCVDSAGQRA